jgi:glycosyltransferase involved in cell wall biosynthesis
MAAKPQLLLYSPQTLPSVGGLQYVVHYWAAALVQKGYNVVVVSHTAGAEAFAEGYRVVVNPPPRLLRQLIKQAAALLMFDVSLKALPQWVGTGTPLYISHQSGLWYPGKRVPLRQRIKRWVANTLAAGQVACSGFIAGHYKNCGVVYNPIRHDIFCIQPEVQRQPVVLFAGRLVTDKGVDVLLRAFALLLQYPEGAGFSLHIAGDGPEKAALQQLAHTLQLDDRVVWPGMLGQQQLANAMRASALMVVPSRLEPMGMVAAEGLACGVPMVLSACGGLPEVGGPFCHYFENGNATDLCRAMRTALTAGMPGNATGLAAHLQQFTVAHSVGEVDRLMG